MLRSPAQSQGSGRQRRALRSVTDSNSLRVCTEYVSRSRETGKEKCGVSDLVFEKPCSVW